ncbi:transporter substrate-binding domain-containing protein [Arcanobacterium pinnipediorum]|uniref:Transporter substrate-binding domain-containing protein n=1 Tax=Arcanobacterium pinnipediorum TaxID=1503041 RepID=A0ABY5AFM3_9ACTO|nr:transporter substrate-binding domain-containing protein [Arcanobacterium pinnipediorum]USR78801.1 transporter substrate-binding domain-containing protein [Arcanobacterium pinnipediorum]
MNNNIVRNHRSRSFVLTTISALMMLLVACSPSITSTPLPQQGSPSSEVSPANSTNFRSLKEIQDSATIRIGIFSDKAPFGSVNSEGEYVGYDVEFGKRIGQDLGVDVEWVPVEAASRVEFLESGKVDIILANFTVTNERAEKVDFADPYMKVALGVATPQNNPLTVAKDIDKRNVVVVKGTTADTFLAKNYPNLKVTKFEQYTEVTNALADGRADAWVTDNTEALAWTGQTSDWVTSIDNFGEESYIAPAVSKGNTELRTWLNNELDALAPEKFFHKAFESTLRPVYGTAVDPDSLVVEGGER